jgi:transposase
VVSFPQMCSACGVLAGPKGQESLKVREWVCGCGAVHDRDRNAAVNILREAKRMVAAGQAETRNAYGGQVRPVTPGSA